MRQGYQEIGQQFWIPGYQEAIGRFLFIFNGDSWILEVKYGEFSNNNNNLHAIVFRSKQYESYQSLTPILFAIHLHTPLSLQTSFASSTFIHLLFLILHCLQCFTHIIYSCFLWPYNSMTFAAILLLQICFTILAFSNLSACPITFFAKPFSQS